MTRRSALAHTLILLLALPGLAHAQTVVGRVVEEGSGTAISGAFVTLVGEGGARVARGLADDAGAFRLTAPEPGTYRVLAERIGYDGAWSDPVELSADAVASTLVSAPSRALELPGLQVSGEGRCELRPEEGAPTFALWEEARKALAIADWTADRNRFLYEIVVFDRELDPRSLVVRKEDVGLLGVRSDQPFATADPDSLAAHGFVRVLQDSMIFYGLDAATLLSDSFLERHCFRRVEGGSALAGLAFQPVDPKRRGGVEGTLWLDGGTFELRLLEFRYVRPPLAGVVDPADYGGRVNFRRLGDGSWVVSHWKIRSPLFGGRRGTRHLGFSEIEGEIMALRTVTGRPVPWSRHAAVLSGQVLNPETGAAAGGAVIRLLDTPYQVQADPSGWFGIDGLPGGRYRVEAVHPDLPRGRIERVVELSRGATSRVRLGG